MSINLKETLLKADEEYEGQIYKLFGPSLMGYPMDADSSRGYMFTSSLKQVLTLLNPDVPRIQTGFENSFGKYSTAYRKIEGSWKVEGKIDKFGNGVVYILVLYNKDTDTYDMIEKQNVENLTEKFGYVYDTSKMDSLDIGDTIKDEVIYKSTSFDEHMNYRYGKNAKVYYTTSNDTIEDAILIRRSWANNVISSEVDIVQVAINDNDVLLNLYGDEEKYKTFPDIGEFVNNSTLCATRRINKNHLLFDFQSHNMKEVYSTDTDYFVPKDSQVIDINIFYNNDDDFPDNVFHSQLKDYHEDICSYADEIFKWSTYIKESGSNYTDDVVYLRSKYQHFNNKEYKWKNRDREFSNLIVEFTVKSNVSLEPGSKLTSRYGDKGVISRIVEDDSLSNGLLEMMGRETTEEEREKLSKHINIIDDDKMPYTDDFNVDIILNVSGAIRRINTGQLYEVELNFISEEIRKRLVTLKTLEEKEDMIFEFLSYVNKDQCDFFYEFYNSLDQTMKVSGRNIRLLDKEGKKKFIEDIEVNGFYLVKPPHSNIRYETIKEIYQRYDFIKPLPLYIDIFGTEKRRVIKDGIVGDKYMLILKQNSNKNFSARSTFRVNRANLPTKDNTKKTNRSSYARSPIRLSEIYNLMSSISGTELAEYNIFMRSSTMGRKSLSTILESDGNPLDIKRLKIKDNYINANADILNAKLKAIGIKLNYVKKGDREDVLIDAITPLYIDNFIIYDTPLNKAMYNKLFYEYRKYVSSISVVESYEGEKQDVAWDYVFNLPQIKEMNIDDDIKEMVILTTKSRTPIKPSELEDSVDDSKEDIIVERKKVKVKKK